MTANSLKMGLRYKPMVFTEKGVAMLSSVLRSKNAIEVNILIMRAFLRIRELLSLDNNLTLRVEQLEREMKKKVQSLDQVFQIINKLLQHPEPKLKKIGFRIDN